MDEDEEEVPVKALVMKAQIMLCLKWCNNVVFIDITPNSSMQNTCVHLKGSTLVRGLMFNETFYPQGAVSIKGLLLHRRSLPRDCRQGVLMLFAVYQALSYSPAALLEVDISPVGITSAARVWASVSAVLH